MGFMAYHGVDCNEGVRTVMILYCIWGNFSGIQCRGRDRMFLRLKLHDYAL